MAELHTENIKYVKDLINKYKTKYVKICEKLHPHYSECTLNVPSENFGQCFEGQSKVNNKRKYNEENEENEETDEHVKETRQYKKK